MFDSFDLTYFLKVFSCLAILIYTGLWVFRMWLTPVTGICRCKTRLDGKVALVTGGNSGIGLETARNLAKRGAKVVIACRTREKSQEAVKDIIKTSGNPNVEYIYLDLSNFSSVRQFAADFNRNYDRLDILVNNAGVAGLKQALSAEGIERIMHINHVAPALLTNLLLDKLKASIPSRIIMVSSYSNRSHKLDLKDLAGKRKLDFWSRYANSKVCNIIWAKALSKRLPQGVTINALEPGLVKTDIFQRMSAFRRFIVHLVIDFFFKTAEEGAQTSIHLAVAPELENVSGEYFAECKPAQADKVTKDDAFVEKVYEETMGLIEKSDTTINS